MAAVTRCALALMLSVTTSIRESKALIGGQATPAARVGTVELSIEHAEGRPGQCSGVVVGDRPLTVLSAAHCFKRPVRDEATQLPRLTVKSAPTGLELRLRTATLSSMAAVDANHAEDIAILTFDATGEVPWTPIPLARDLEEAASVLICGFGSALTEPEVSDPHCVEKKLIPDLANVDEFLPAQFKIIDLAAYAHYAGQFAATARAISSMDKYVAVNRLVDGAYSRSVPMPREGDSGGPWFTRNARGELRVLALSELIQTFRFYTKRWPVFGKGAYDHHELPFAYYGLKLRTPEAAAIIARARALGADVREDVEDHAATSNQ